MIHNHEDGPMGIQAHVIRHPGLNIQPLTVEQALAVHLHTGFRGLLPDHLETQRKFDQPVPYADRRAAAEQFLRLSPLQTDDMADYPMLTQLVYDIIKTTMATDPFAIWDSQVDILLACHLNRKTQAALRVSLELEYNATVEFTERPGELEQTWIVIHRPDPSHNTMNEAVNQFVTWFDEHNNDTVVVNPEGYSRQKMPMAMSVPKAHEEELLRRVGEITGPTIAVSLERERFKRQSPTIVLTRHSKGPTDPSQYAIKASGAGGSDLEPAFTGTINEVRIASQLSGTNSTGPK